MDVERAARHAGLRAQMSEERDTVQRARERLACIEIEVLQPGLRLLGARRASIVRRRDVGAVRFADLREREYSRGARELDAWSTSTRWTRSGHAHRELHVRAAYMKLQLLQRTRRAVRQRDAGGEQRRRRELEPFSDAVRPPVEPQQHLLIVAPDTAGTKDGMLTHRLDQGAARIATSSGSVVPRAAVLDAVGHGTNAPQRARQRLRRMHAIIGREDRESRSSVEV